MKKKKKSQNLHDVLCTSGFLDMLTRAQCYRVDDQRGLLTKEQLEVPVFLKLSSDQAQEADKASTTSSSTADSKDDGTSLTPSSAGAAEETSDSARSEPKDLRETAV